MKKAATSLLPVFALSACLGGGKEGPQPGFEPVLAPEKAEMTQHDGAIFQAAHGYAALTSGPRGHGRGYHYHSACRAHIRNQKQQRIDQQKR